MKNVITFIAFCILIATLISCKSKQVFSKHNIPSEVWSKIKLDFKSLDKNGLSGPDNGKVSMSYEFCIEQDPKLWDALKAIDKTLRKSTSKGRIGCKSTQWLCIGDTHQPQYKKVLFDLASFEAVEKILPVYFE